MENKQSPADQYIRIDNSQKYYLFKTALPEMERLNQETVEKRDAEIKEELEKNPLYLPPAPPEKLHIFIQDKPFKISLGVENLETLAILDERAVDVLDYIVSRIILRKPSPSEEITINIDSMLTTFGLKRNTYSPGKECGYSTAQRRQHFNYIEALSRLWIITEEQEGKKGEKRVVEQRLFAVRQRERDSTTSAITEVTIQLNAFFDNLLTETRQCTANIPTKTLGLHPINRSFEKRIGKYFHRFSKKERAHYMFSILKNCQIPVDKKRKSAFRKRVEQALDRLVTDGIIIRYAYLSRADTFDLWLDAKLEIVLP